MNGSFDGAACAPADSGGNVLPGVFRRQSELSPRERSLIAVANLIACRRTEELPRHLARALENGVSREELIEVIAHGVFSRRAQPEPVGDVSATVCGLPGGC